MARPSPLRTTRSQDGRSPRSRRNTRQVEVEDQGKVIGGAAGQAVADDAGVADVDVAAVKHLVERGQGEEGRKTAEAAGGGGGLVEAVPREMMPAQGVAPVVVIAGDDRGQVGGFEEDAMAE